MRMSERRKPYRRYFFRNAGFWTVIGPITLIAGLYCYGMIDFEKWIETHHLFFAWSMIGLSLSGLAWMTHWKMKRRNQW